MSHKWLHRPKDKRWHPYNGKLTIEEMQKIAATHGGQFISIIRSNGEFRLKWKCAFGHQWESDAEKRDSWCRQCDAGLTEDEFTRLVTK
jgi:hypothetical protein